MLHGDGDVSTLSHALDEKFDAYYASLADERVGFSKCELGYVVESEGLQTIKTFDEWSLAQESKLEAGMELDDEL